MQIGVVGLGRMGGNIARRLIRHGHEPVVYDRDATRRAGNRGIVACSALKRAYRDILIGARRDVRLVFLNGDRELIARRIAARADHFMPPQLLDSQFEALEPPTADERPIVVSIVPHPRDIVETIVRRLKRDAAAAVDAGGAAR